MPEGHDNQNGRMLFTDFDASDKGRPVPVLAVNAPRGPAGPLPTLADIASTLELDFEDDGDDAAPASYADTESGGDDARSRQQAGFVRNDEDQELSLDEAGTGGINAKADSGIYPGPSFSSSPTWEEFTRAFQQSPHIETPPDMPTRPPRASPGAVMAPDGPDMLGEDDDGMDVLSMLTSMAEEEFSVHPVPPPPSVPYGGIERVDDWYDPPEDQADPFVRLDDWYEPPIQGKTSGRANADDGWLSAWQNEMASGDELHRPTRRIPRPATERQEETGPSARSQPAHDTTVELFADIDLDRMWEDKLRQPHGGRSQESDTRQLDLFDNLDLDNLWEQRVNQPLDPADDSRKRSAEKFDGEKTTILGAGDMEKAGTIAVPDNFYRSKTKLTGKDTEKTSPLRQAQTAASSRSAATDPEAEDVLEELERLSEESSSAKGKKAASSLDAASADPLAFVAGFDDDWDDSSVRADVAVPVIGDEDMEDLVAQAKKNRKTKTTIKAMRDKTPADPAEKHHGKTRVRKIDVDENASGGSRSADVETAHVSLPAEDQFGIDDGDEPDYIPDVRDADEMAPPPKRGLTTDDLLADVDFDQYGADSTVSAPVIDDSAIHEVGKRRRPGTEELAAIIDQGGDPGLDAEEEEEDPAESVPVNPLDVFANMDDMDFSDDVDDDMRAMMEEEEEEEEEAQPAASTEASGGSDAAAMREPPKNFLGKVRHYAGAGARKVLPMSLLERVQHMIAWRENWWFYCDLAAAIIASASLAVIISYWFWYRN